MKLVCLAVLAAVSVAAGAQQPTFRCVDANGRSTYTNVKEEMAGRKCSALSREVSVVPVPAAPAPVTATAPKEVRPAKAQAQVPAVSPGRANERRRILQEELGDEEKRLGEARQRLAEQQSSRGGDERNYQRVIDRLKPYVEAVEQHEKNIAQLKRELAQ